VSDPPPSSLPRRIARRYDTCYLRGYARGKLGTDPAYEAVRQRLIPDTSPVLDIGCGIGLCSLYLHGCGYEGPVHGIDPDPSKIEPARRATRDCPGLTFDIGEADVLPHEHRGHIVMLDVLHYLDRDKQQAVLHQLAERIPPGGWCILRATPVDRSWRFHMTRLEEWFARTIGWMRRSAVTFPRKEAVVEPFHKAGFSSEVRPLWGKTPFNSYLFAFQRKPLSIASGEEQAEKK